MTNAPIGGRGARNSDDDDEVNDVSLPTSEAPRNQVKHRRRGLPRSNERDRLTRPKAQHLAERIRVFWKAQGRDVRVWIEPIDDSTSTEWCVRSTIVVAAPESRP